MTLKIAIVVHGRFHAFDLAKSLLRLGHEVTIFTNYPIWAVKRFNLSPQHVRSFWIHGVIVRILTKLPYQKLYEPWIHRIFSKWAAIKLAKEHWDVVHVWSGVAEEILSKPPQQKVLSVLMRGSAHIATQARLLKEEKIRTRSKVDGPSRWMIARESREYEYADIITPLSTFAYHSFIAENICKNKLCLISPGVDLKAFYPSAQVVEERCRRILSNQPLQILYVGAITFRKGMYDLIEIIKRLVADHNIHQFSFRFIGPIDRNMMKYLKPIKKYIHRVPKCPQSELYRWYATGDIFIFPTIEDGFAVVLGQAKASALPIITTTNCGGIDIIQENKAGWILPIRDPEAFVKQLYWCNTHRDELANMVRKGYSHTSMREWDDMAKEFVAMCLQKLKK